MGNVLCFPIKYLHIYLIHLLILKSFGDNNAPLSPISTNFIFGIMDSRVTLTLSVALLEEESYLHPQASFTFSPDKYLKYQSISIFHGLGDI